MQGLNDSQIAELLAPSPVAGFQPEQHGPLRWFDIEMRCASRGCSSPTYCKVEGIPRCLIHALKELNEMLTEREENNENVN